MVKKSVSRVVKVFTLLLSVFLLATITIGAASAGSSYDNCDKQCSYDSSCYKQCFVSFTASCDDNECDDNECDDNECEVNHWEGNNCEEHGDHHDRCDYRCKDSCKDSCKEHGDHHDRCDYRCKDSCKEHGDHHDRCDYRCKDYCDCC